MANTTSVPATMKAWQYKNAKAGLEKSLQLNEAAPVPELKANESLIKVHATSLNPVDHKLPELPFPASLAIKTPGVPAIDFAGVLASTTIPSLKDLEGKRIFGRVDPPAQHGTCAEYAVVKGEGSILALPDSVSFADASCIGTAAATAWQMIVDEMGGEGAVKGKKIFVNGGSGGVGVFAIQIAKALGAKSVATSCSSANVKLVESLGADLVIDYKTQSMSSVLTSSVDGDLNSNGFDHVADCVGKPASLHKDADHFLKPSGLFVQIGGGFSMGDVSTMSQRALLPSMLGGGKRKWKFMSMTKDQKMYERLRDLMVEGKVKAVIGASYKFAQVPEAFAKLKEGSGSGGKLVVNVVEG